MVEFQNHMSHWGAFIASEEDGEVAAVKRFPTDFDPSPLLDNIPGSVRHISRVRGPAVRRGWLEQGPGPSERRGYDEFVAVTWDEVTELLAGELRRVVDRYGNEAIYGGSYGWASAGRFHHAQSQIHRFLNMLGGYTAGRGNYSFGASEAIMPRVVAQTSDLFLRGSAWETLLEHTDLIVAFGGISPKNSDVEPGGVSEHRNRRYIKELGDSGVRLVSFSPLRDDFDDEHVQWYSPIPGTDVPVMLAMAYVLVTENLHDLAFLDRYCVGYPVFERYVLGLDDGVAKTPQWAQALSGIPADEIASLARALVSCRSFITVSWSLQRTQYGEQAPWMALALAAMVGQIGLPGGGFGHGYGSTSSAGGSPLYYGLPTFPQGKNPIEAFIPIAAVSELLMRPGETIDYDGQRLVLPDIHLVYWAGGNPFHHQQNLARFKRGLWRMDTVVVHDPFWTATARHADIVMASTTTLEREDYSGSTTDPRFVAMHQVTAPYADSRDDYTSLAMLAEELGFGAEFTEGRNPRQWLLHLYEQWRAKDPLSIPPFEEFWDKGHVELPTEEGLTLLSAFREDPEANPLITPSGRIEIFSEEIDSFDYDDCHGHPRWLEPAEWLGGPRAKQFPLHLIVNQPRTRLHSQLDHGAYSQSSKVHGREPARMHPQDAQARGITEGDVVRIFNDRGACLAGVLLDEKVRPRVAQLSTGAWYDPLDPSDPQTLCVHGNPNVLTSDQLTSKLGQGCTGQHVLVQIERYDGPFPPIHAYDQPPFANRETISRHVHGE
jgi:biotin/methionine sulfoxide reductase